MANGDFGNPIPDSLIPPIPLTFTRYTVKGFPEVEPGKSVDTLLQFAFRQFDTAPFSRIVSIGTAQYPEYTRYRIEHETWLDCLIRVEGNIQTRVKRIVVFNMYVNKSDPIRVWFQSKKTIADEFIRRVNAVRLGDLQATRHEINVIKLLQDYKNSGKAAEEIVSGWFINLRIPKLRTAMLDGPDVTESSDWKRYMRGGDLASVDIVLQYAGDNLRTIVTKRGTIVFRRRIGEGIALELLDGLAKKFGPYTTEKSVKASGTSHADKDDVDVSGTGDDENDK
jgi:hypothetical protein